MDCEVGHSRRGADRRVMGRAGLAVAAAFVWAFVGAPRDASACGACYAASSESTIVDDHRMALAVSKQRTILWDQISYSGNPSEFAYVVPVREGTRVEPSTDAWFEALDASTRPIIMAPQSYGAGWGGDGEGSDESSGCACSGEQTSAAFADRGGAGADAAASKDAGPPPVDVVEQKVVGPYDAVTLRSKEPKALETWLRDHGYAIPPESDPIVADYVKNGFDFIALRLRPDDGARAIQPIRIVTPGADPTLPLRMMQIGAGASLAVTLWVIGEGRWHTANFPDATIDYDKLIWDYTLNRSNYQELARAAMAEGGGRAFLTEYADAPDLSPSGPFQTPGTMGNVGLASAYRRACPEEPATDAGAGDDAGDDAGDASAIDDGGDAAVLADGGDDAGDAGDGGAPPVVVQHATCDDLDVAFDGISVADARVTRLRAVLPHAALDATLTLEPAPTQERVDNVHVAKSPGAVQARIVRRGPTGRHGTYALVAATAFVLSRLLRRRRAASR